MCVRVVFCEHDFIFVVLRMVLLWISPKQIHAHDSVLGNDLKGHIRWRNSRLFAARVRIDWHNHNYSIRAA